LIGSENEKRFAVLQKEKIIKSIKINIKDINELSEDDFHENNNFFKIAEMQYD
jgi:hypothetical protein